MKTKALLTIIAICLIFGLAGCGVSKKEESPDVDAADNQFAGSVWLGTNKDVMYEFRLEFVNNDTVYLLQMLDGEIEQAEKGSYSLTGEEIDFQSITLVEIESYDTATQRISATLAGSGLLIYFRPADEALMDQKALDSFIEEGKTAGDNTADRTYILEGWPEEVPMPDFGGEIRSDQTGSGGSGSSSRTINFQNIDPNKVQPYLDALVAAGFEVTEQRDILPEEETDENGNHKYEAMVDENGNPFYTHRFEAVNGEIVENEYFSSLESGYAISIGYTLQEQYDKATGQFIGKPYARLVLYFGADKKN